MHFFAIAKLLGLLLLTLAASMLPALAFAVYYDDGSQPALIEAMVVTALAGGALYVLGRLRQQDLFQREAMAFVGLAWMLAAAAGALPFWFHGCFETFADCYFESMSGFTTTGASIIAVGERLPQGVESLPRGLLFWRSFTHWLGGMGIVVLFVALLPFLGVGGRALFRSETPGPLKDAMTPRVKETAKILWTIYVALTAAETAALMVLGLDLHEALCHAFGTLATGGYSTRNASIAAFDNAATQLVIVLFMVAAATNFSLYFRFLRGDRRAFWKDTEWRVFIAIFATCSLLAAGVLQASGHYDGFLLALRHALFQVVSVMTTTGYCTADFNEWPAAIKSMLVVLMFVGGSAGSTGGGLKVIRVVILTRVAEAVVERVFSPRGIRKVRVGGAVLGEDVQLATLTFFLLWMGVFAAGSIAICFLEGDIDLVTGVTAVAATLNNIGPGLGLVGASGHYAFFPPAAKYLLSLFMVLGRLELFTILVLFVPRFWRVN